MSLYCDFGDYAEFYKSKTQQSRKQRECDECGGPIEVGEEYERAFMVYESIPETFLTCCRCLPMADWVLRNCGCRMHADLWRHLEEDVFQEMRSDLAPGVRFKVGRWLVMRRRWRAAQTSAVAA